MDRNDTSCWESAVLEGGPADGLRTRVADRPHVLQVTRPCPPDGPDADMEVSALYVYRRDPRTDCPPLRYTFDVASP
ncbi:MULTISPECIES: hypothetical protein [unclassified Streptomyces]|uniref:hypothetical protein n=1 Tax=unclassified Streptomyces TaxID=2593676 RepID=UPI0037A2092C